MTRPIRILLAEDDTAARTLLNDFFAPLEDMAVCAAARDGYEALELLERERPDVVLLDLIMPGLDGLGVLQQLRAHPVVPRPKVIVLSRVASSHVVSYAFSLGADYYLIKPVHLATLPGLIRVLYQDPLEQAAAALLADMGGGGLGAEAAAIAAAALAGARGKHMLLKQAYLPAMRRGRTSYACVEKNIREMVRRIHSAAPPEYCALMGGRPEKRPSNDCFLRRLADRAAQLQKPFPVPLRFP